MRKVIIIVLFAGFGFASCTETKKQDVKTSESDTAVLKDHDGEHEEVND